MRFLSEIISTAYCQASQAATPDRFFAVGCRVVGAHWLPLDAADAARIGSQVSSLSGDRRLPWEPDTELDGIFNDIFSPFREEEDGRLYVWIPVPVEEALSSTLLASDWRAVAMAWWAARRISARPDMVVVFSAFDSSGRVVSADMTAGELYAAMGAAMLVARGPHERPGGACASCGLSARCRSLAEHSADMGQPLPPGAPDKGGLRALRLYNERAAVSQKLEFLERRRDAVDDELSKLVHDGRVRLGPDEELEIPVRTTSSWEYRDVRNVLDSFGAWDDSVASVRTGALRKLMEKLPPKAVDMLNKKRADRTSQPSISEAARHGRFAARPSSFGGVPLQGKGRLGKG